MSVYRPESPPPRPPKNYTVVVSPGKSKTIKQRPKLRKEEKTNEPLCPIWMCARGFSDDLKVNNVEYKDLDSQMPAKCTLDFLSYEHGRKGRKSICPKGPPHVQHKPPPIWQYLSTA